MIHLEKKGTKAIAPRSHSHPSVGPQSVQKHTEAQSKHPPRSTQTTKSASVPSPFRPPPTNYTQTNRKTKLNPKNQTHKQAVLMAECDWKLREIWKILKRVFWGSNLEPTLFVWYEFGRRNGINLCLLRSFFSHFSVLRGLLITVHCFVLFCFATLFCFIIIKIYLKI